MIIPVLGNGRTGVFALCLLSGCVFDTASSATATALEDTDTDAQGTEGPGSDTTGSPGTTADSTGASQGSTSMSEGSSSGAADETSSSADPTQGNPPRADLVFVEEGPVELGVHPLSGASVLTLQLSNQGEAAASILGGEPPPSPLLWAGDAFPGTDATCQGLIPPGGACTVTLAVGPGHPGFASGPVEVRFDDAIGSGIASVFVDVTATGKGPNLIENPDAESDPVGAILTGWDAEDSSFHTTTSENHGEGSFSFFGGGSETPQMTQDVILTPWSASIDELGLRFAFTGWSRSNDDFWNDDPHGISITFLDGTGAALDDAGRSGMTHDGWESTSFDVPIPIGSRRVRIRLTCDRNDALINNSNCSAWFDDFTGALVYAPK